MGENKFVYLLLGKINTIKSKISFGKPQAITPTNQPGRLKRRYARKAQIMQ